MSQYLQRPIAICKSFKLLRFIIFVPDTQEQRHLLHAVVISPAKPLCVDTVFWKGLERILKHMHPLSRLAFFSDFLTIGCAFRAYAAFKEIKQLMKDPVR